MKRIILALLVGAAVFSTVFAAAALLNVDAGVLQAGSDEVLTCDADGVQVTYQDGWQSSLDDFGITATVVAGINAACNGRLVEVVLTDIGGNWLASGSGTFTNPTNVTATMSPVVAARDVYDVHVIIR